MRIRFALQMARSDRCAKLSRALAFISSTYTMGALEDRAGTLLATQLGSRSAISGMMAKIPTEPPSDIPNEHASLRLRPSICIAVLLKLLLLLVWGVTHSSALFDLA